MPDSTQWPPLLDAMPPLPAKTATSDPGERELLAVLLTLTLLSGIVDAVCYLGLGRVFTANMTGNVAVLGFATAWCFPVSP